MKNDQKNPIYPSVLVSCMFKQANLLLSTEQDKALKRATYEFETWIFGSKWLNPSGLSCISPIHSFCHVSCMHHIVALAWCWSCFVVFIVVGPASEDIHEYPTEGQYPATTPSGKKPLIIPIQTHVLASALIYCIKTTRFKLLCAMVVNPFPLHDLSLPQ